MSLSRFLQSASTRKKWATVAIAAFAALIVGFVSMLAWGVHSASMERDANVVALFAVVETFEAVRVGVANDEAALRGRVIASDDGFVRIGDQPPATVSWIHISVDQSTLL